MTAVAILQARMGSSRFPGKVLQRAAGRSVLDWVIRAMERTPGIDEVCVAIPDVAGNTPIVEEARRCGARIARGSETDVLDRFAVAAEVCKADIVMRVTTDCPLTDPTINGKILALLKDKNVDYACNNEPFSFPHGLDCEVFTRAVLERARAEASEPYDREHVTPWIKRSPSVSHAYFHGPGGEHATWRWTVDYPEDMEFFRAIAETLGDGLSDSRKVIELLTKKPNLLEINRIRYQR